MNTNKNLVTIASIVIVAITVVALIFLTKSAKQAAGLPVDENEQVAQVPGETIRMCYRYEKKLANGLADRAVLNMELNGNQVTGEYQNLPAEKDSKVGTFLGTVGPMDPAISARTADVFWYSLAEGMTVTEELHIQFGEGSAVALFGEMVDRGDGMYDYKDTTKLTPGFQMGQVACVV